jgi:hypothetical protein
MTRRDAVAAGIGALGSAAVLVLLYDMFPPSRPAAPVAPHPQASDVVEAPGGEDSCTAANSRLADGLKECEHRLVTRETELTAVKTILASLARDASTGELADPYNPSTPQDWKYLASFGVVRAKNFCFNVDWQPSDIELGQLGLAPDDGPALTRAVAAADERLWQATEPACAKLVGTQEAARLGNEECWSNILYSFEASQWDADAQLVADIRAGNVPMPAASELDALATRFLAMTSAVSDLEKDLTESFGTERAHEIAAADYAPWGGCSTQIGEGSRTGKLPMPK